MDRTEPYKIKLYQFLEGMTDDLNSTELEYATQWIMDYVCRPMLREFADPTKWDGDVNH